MVLKFNNNWRFQAPEDGAYVNKCLPFEAVEKFLGLASKVATQGSRQGLLEHFKFKFAAAGVSYVRSSNEQQAASDLERNMIDAADNTPVFIEAYYDACASLTRRQWLGHLPFRG